MGSISSTSPVVTRAGTPYFTPANSAGAAVNPNDPKTPTLFRPLRIRDVTLKNRVVVSPMCMYSAESDPTSPFVGALTDYHIAHLGHFALKGAGLVFVEAQAVLPNGRISPNDAGLWQEGTESEHQDAKVAVQLAHAGRKASVAAPVRVDESAGGWPKDVGGDSYWTPRALSTAEIKDIVRAFGKSAALAIEAGVDVIEVHAAHGYLLHQFLSPVTNQRTDEYGGSFENRTRLLREVGTPLFVRISATECWDIDSSLNLVKMFPELGVDLVDKIQLHTNYQVDLAGRVRKAIRDAGASTLVGGVGFITEAEQAQGIVQGADEAHETEALLSGPEPKADVVLLARQFMREPEWSLPLNYDRYIPWTEEKGEITACGIPINYNASKEWADKKVVLFAVPGAFTPTCSVNHVPGYIKSLPQLKEKGVQVVAVIASNDAYVMSAWGKANQVTNDDLLFLSDPDAKFSESIGWSNGPRTGRYAIIIDHGKVSYAQIETEKGVKVSGADAVLAHL
ncbi:FMN-linked oxidoreductase [Aspergillus avenaceus]|uniref:Thioredoxin peroxidase n=1 Tax=Aspergillus avenaceus TaxID=36643 RepID=A0A5N6TND1_ASPAV|nr:FMN-linked oxidoreductase [Aspergillus avenaceus]